ncbi:MAG: phasin family protein [Rhodocyclaceae bacterium]|nr:phasin family protein [Rhodocyclaceae bacterium]
MATKKISEKLSLNLADAVRDSAEEIWMAGLGAFSKAQREGNKMFDLLVSEGKQLQGKVKGVADNVSGKVADKLAENRVAELADKAVAGWDKFGQVLEDRTSEALGRFGVATKKDTDALSRRVAKLATELEKMRRTPKKSPVRKSVT